MYSVCFALCMDTFEKSTKDSVASRYFARTPSMIQWIIRICNGDDPFSWKLFWLSQRILSISDLIRLRSRVIIYLSSNRRKSYASTFLGDSEVIVFREGGDAAFRPVFCLYPTLQNRKSKSSNFLVFHASRSISSRPVDFLLLIFISTT